MANLSGSKDKAGPQGDSEARYLDPFKYWDRQQMDDEVNRFLKETGLQLYEWHIRRGAYLAQDPKFFDSCPDLFDKYERKQLELENQKGLRGRFNQPLKTYALVFCCSMGAAVQGWDESAINGAQLYYVNYFGLVDRDVLYGLINGAPYLCCAISCLLVGPFLNRYTGRKGTIFVTCLVSALSCLGQAFAQNWKQLLATRILLGIGIGPKSATIPVYAAECVPAPIRGALVMQWQVWTAFGIFLGFICGVIFRDTGVNWRLMLGSPMPLPVVLCLLVFSLPESPRWLLQRHRYEKAYKSLRSLRHTDLQTGRDLFRIHHLLKLEEKTSKGKRIKGLFTIPRCRHALFASLITMVFQQFCGVNILAYYSSTVFANTDSSSNREALLLSMGFGLLNFVFAVPAIFWIDTLGRRSLLLLTFPLMAIFQIAVGTSFLVDGRLQKILVVVFSYLFAVVYSVGEGPVPFLYSAESLPLFNRDYGMGLITSVNWLFNFVLAITWPPLVKRIDLTGGFLYYGGWCVLGWVMILLFVPETKRYGLEELHAVFAKSTRGIMRHGILEASWFLQYYLLRRTYLKRPLLIKPAQGPNEGDGIMTMRPLPPEARLNGLADSQGREEGDLEQVG